MASEEQKTKNTKAFEAAIASILPHNNVSTVALSDTYSLANITPIDDEWYFSVKCKKCERTTPVLSDPSKGKRGNPFSGPGKLRVNCHHCQNEIQVGADEILPVQWR